MENFQPDEPWQLFSKNPSDRATLPALPESQDPVFLDAYSDDRSSVADEICVGIAPLCCTRPALVSASSGSQLCDHDLSPPCDLLDLDNLKQEPCEDENLPYQAPSKAATENSGLLFCAEKRDEETSAEADDNCSDVEFSTDDDDSIYDDSKRSKIRNPPPSSSRIRKTRVSSQTFSAGRSGPKPYSRQQYLDDVAKELREQLARLDRRECSNMDVVKHLERKFPLYAECGEFTCTWVTKVRFGHVMRAVTGRKPVNMRKNGIKRAPRSSGATTTVQLTDKLFRKILSSMPEFETIAALAHEFNVNRSVLTRRIRAHSEYHPHSASLGSRLPEVEITAESEPRRSNRMAKRPIKYEDSDDEGEEEVDYSRSVSLKNIKMEC